MELNSPAARLNVPKAPAQPKIEGDEIIQRCIKDATQELQPHELGDNDPEPSVQELQHRIFMLETAVKSLNLLVYKLRGF